jgi:hypothetical protein
MATGAFINPFRSIVADEIFTGRYIKLSAEEEEVYINEPLKLEK